MTTFTLIAFSEGEEGWWDRCGYWNEGSPSELNIDYSDNAKETGFMWAYTERQYETCKLLINGIDAECSDDPEILKHWEEAEAYRKEQSDILKEEHDRKEAEKLRIANEKKANEEALRKKKLEDTEREQLRQLKLKYGG